VGEICFRCAGNGWVDICGSNANGPDDGLLWGVVRACWFCAYLHVECISAWFEDQVDDRWWSLLEDAWEEWELMFLRWKMDAGRVRMLASCRDAWDRQRLERAEQMSLFGGAA
jgi:hypothetical protein